MVTKIDRIDNKGFIREHLTRDGERTICGLILLMTQRPCGNGLCKRCAMLAKASHEQAQAHTDSSASSSEEHD